MSKTPRIMATSGGFVGADLWNVRKPGKTVQEMLRLTGKDRPKICFIMTATGDDPTYLKMMYDAATSYGLDATHLELFTQPNAPIDERILGSDVVWVGGGSVANLLAVWRIHGLDVVLRQAWQDGVILGGVSAGSLCWHVGGTTDSFGATLQPITNGLALLPYGNGVHYDSEEQRRPLLHSLVADGTLPLSYATDDYVGILYEGTEPVQVVVDKKLDPVTGPAAYRVELVDGAVVETRLAPGPIT
jgi:peptidase E